MIQQTDLNDGDGGDFVQLVSPSYCVDMSVAGAAAVEVREYDLVVAGVAIPGAPRSNRSAWQFQDHSGALIRKGRGL